MSSHMQVSICKLKNQCGAPNRYSAVLVTDQVSSSTHTSFVSTVTVCSLTASMGTLGSVRLLLALCCALPLHAVAQSQSTPLDIQKIANNSTIVLSGYNATGTALVRELYKCNHSTCKGVTLVFVSTVHISERKRHIYTRKRFVSQR